LLEPGGQGGILRSSRTWDIYPNFAFAFLFAPKQTTQLQLLNFVKFYLSGNNSYLSIPENDLHIIKMAPPTNKDISNADADFQFHVLSATEELKANQKAVAAAASLSAYNNA
jgi:hypothetical protein